MPKKRLSLEERLANYREWETARRAASAAATPTSSPEASGAPTTVVATIQSESPDSGKTQSQPTTGRILDLHGNIETLAAMAAEYDREMKAVLFVAAAFAPTVRRRPLKARMETYPLKNGELGYWEILTRAKDWDEMGLTTPSEFVEALACEVVGTSKEAAVSAVLRDTGFEAVNMSDLESDMGDDYGRWRYGED